jgi:dolichyl-diphosphooligosaccharide--protein glycosyltransferase
MRSPQVRVFKVKKVSKKSKDWVADPANRVCDAPGSWFCSGQYPPALQEFISKRRDFKQLEDFNVKKDTHSQKYHEEYMRRMGGG